MDGNHLSLTGARTGPVAVAWVRTAGIVACCLLVSLGAQVRIPIPGTDVPMTLQPLAVLLTGFALSPKRAVMAMMLYLTCGAAGFPVFAPGSGGISGLTGGYLVGFVAAAWTVAQLKGGRDATYARRVWAALVGTTIVFCSGIGWRVFCFGGNVSLAVVTGFVPFAGKAVVVVLLSAAVAQSVGRWRGVSSRCGAAYEADRSHGENGRSVRRSEKRS